MPAIRTERAINRLFKPREWQWPQKIRRGQRTQEVVNNLDAPLPEQLNRILAVDPALTRDFTDRLRADIAVTSAPLQRLRGNELLLQIERHHGVEGYLRSEVDRNYPPRGYPVRNAALSAVVEQTAKLNYQQGPDGEMIHGVVDGMALRVTHIAQTAKSEPNFSGTYVARGETDQIPLKPAVVEKLFDTVGELAKLRDKLNTVVRTGRTDQAGIHS